MGSSTGVAGSAPRTGFLRSVFILASGAAAAHVITAAAMPVLSRLYSPNDFSTLAVFTGLLSVIGVAAGLRFDIAVSIPGSDADAVNVMGLGLACAAVISALLLVPALLLPQQIGALLGQPALSGWLWMLPPAVFLVVAYSALQSWFIRRNAFGLLSRTRIAQSAATSGVQVAMGLAALAPVGLLFGYTLNAGAAVAVLGAHWLWTERAMLRELDWARLRAMAILHQRFPKYSTFEALGNTAAIQVPIILIASVGSGPEAGYLAMGMFVMQAPMALIGTAIGQVYLSRAPEEHRAGTLRAFTSEIFGGLIKAGVGPLLFAGILSPVIFAIVFGAEWRRAGELVAWMTPWFIMQFVASPISMSLHITGHQRTALVLQIAGLLVRVAAVLGAAAAGGHFLAESYAVSGFVVYLGYLAVILFVLGVPAKALFLGLRAAAGHIALWLVAAIAARVILELVL